MPDTPLNPDAIEASAAAARIDWSGHTDWNGAPNSVQIAYRNLARTAVSAYLAAALPEVTSKVEAFINQRPEYIQALKNTRSGDDMSDYSRWNGHAESRRQLAQALGWTVPHNPGETTRPEVNDV